VTAAFEYCPAEQSFLDPVRADAHDPGSARAVVIPFGLEASVSYGGGTAAGPAAIVKASQQLELYDDELECEPYRAWGVATVREPTIARPIEAALDQLAGLVEGGCACAATGQGRNDLLPSLAMGLLGLVCCRRRARR